MFKCKSNETIYYVNLSKNTFYFRKCGEKKSIEYEYHSKNIDNTEKWVGFSGDSVCYIDIKWVNKNTKKLVHKFIH